jgi:hypothetical protein
MFAKLQKETLSFVMSLCPLDMTRLSLDGREIRYLSSFQKFGEKIHNFIKGKTCISLENFAHFLELLIPETSHTECQDTHFKFDNFFWGQKSCRL